MIKIYHNPTYLIKIYCAELNILHSILYSGHRGQRILFTEVSPDEISVFVLCLCECECVSIRVQAQ